MSKNRDFKPFLLRLALLLALARKSEFDYSDKISKERIKQISRENCYSKLRTAREVALLALTNLTMHRLAIN